MPLLIRIISIWEEIPFLPLNAFYPLSPPLALSANFKLQKNVQRNVARCDRALDGREKAGKGYRR